MAPSAVLRSLAMLLSACVGSTTNITLWPNGAPGEQEGWPGPETAVPGDDGITRIYNVSVPTLMPFLLNASSTTGGHPAVIIAPGGGYSLLAWDLEGTDVAKRFNSHGLSAFVLKYRVPARPDDNNLPKWWAPLQDAQRASQPARVPRV